MKKCPLLAGNHCFANLRTDKQVRHWRKEDTVIVGAIVTALNVYERNKGGLCANPGTMLLCPQLLLCHSWGQWMKDEAMVCSELN